MLPSSLKSLNIQNTAFNAYWDSLPPQLEELKLNRSAIESLPQLPQSLNTLELLEIRKLTSEDDLNSLSKNLTRVRLVEREMSPSVLQRLPVTLTDLEVNLSAMLPDIVSLIRPGTTRIHLKAGPFSETLNVFPFPTKLQYLRIHFINDDICAMLPPGLQVLHITEGLITAKGSTKLPKSLTSLKTCLDVFDNNQSLSHLRYISKMDFNTKRTPLGELTENWLSSLLPPSSSSPTPNDIFVSGCTEICDYNNYHLTSLALASFSTWYDKLIIAPRVQKPLFASLQNFKNLNRLHIWYCGCISSDWLCLIPQSVTDLNLHSLSTLPTANQLSTLPTCLKYLNLFIEVECNFDCDWTDEILQSLPRSLHKSMSKLENSMIFTSQT